MYLTALKLRNFRNYRRLDLDVPPGLVVLAGANAQGKSNLLEAVHLLAVGRSSRAGSDRELVSWDAPEHEQYAQISARVTSCGEETGIQVDLIRSDAAAGAPSRENGAAPPNVQKRVRVNGVPRRTTELVGRLNAVLFEAADLDIVEGAPSQRRRYLDMLLSQADTTYLRSLQRYQRVLTQRNHLLRLIREGRARRDALAFWDEELVSEGAFLLRRRTRAVRLLAGTARLLYARLRGEEALEMAYESSVGRPEDMEGDPGEAIRGALERSYPREVAMGTTHVGPHRDDLRLEARGREVGAYGSRGERRIAALVLRLAESEYLASERGDRPVLLLDDILSELDLTRRRQVLELARQYGQVLLRTTDESLAVVDDVNPSAILHVAHGAITRV